jgi:hypothetical protein
LHPHCGGGRPRQIGTGEDDLVQALHPGVSEGGQHQAQRVGEKFVEAGAGAELAINAHSPKTPIARNFFTAILSTFLT